MVVGIDCEVSSNGFAANTRMMRVKRSEWWKRASTLRANVLRGGKLAVVSAHARSFTHLDSQPLFAIQTQVSLREGERDIERTVSRQAVC